MVDRLMPCLKNANWRHNKSCHMFAADPDLEKLHAFASQIGLKRSWFQQDTVMPHYNLNASKRMQAVAKGAVEVDRQVTACVMREWRRRNGMPEKLHTDGDSREATIRREAMRELQIDQVLILFRANPDQIGSSLLIDRLEMPPEVARAMMTILNHAGLIEHIPCPGDN